MNILLTGVTGFLGSNLLISLLGNGHKVVGLKRKSSSLSRLPDLLISNFSLFDIEDGLDFLDTLSFDVVIHTATSYGIKTGSLAEIGLTNEVLPLRLLDKLRYNKNLIFVNTHTSLPILTSEYSVSKGNFINWMQYVAKNWNIKFINISLEHFYGFGDGRFIEYLIKAFLDHAEKIDITLGEQLRDFIYIKDVVAAYLCILGNLVNIESCYTNIGLGTGNTISIKELALMIKRITKNNNTKLNFGAIPYRKDELMKSEANIEYIKTLGWQPKFTVEDGINDYLWMYNK